eukprot:SAG22_NODE_1060_length_5764_cov_2.176876_3_plen_64_part_00
MPFHAVYLIFRLATELARKLGIQQAVGGGEDPTGLQQECFAYQETKQNEVCDCSPGRLEPGTF